MHVLFVLWTIFIFDSLLADSQQYSEQWPRGPLLLRRRVVAKRGASVTKGAWTEWKKTTKSTTTVELSTTGTDESTSTRRSTIRSTTEKPTTTESTTTKSTTTESTTTESTTTESTTTESTTTESTTTESTTTESTTIKSTTIKSTITESTATTESHSTLAMTFTKRPIKKLPPICQKHEVPSSESELDCVWVSQPARQLLRFQNGSSGTESTFSNLTGCIVNHATIEQCKALCEANSLCTSVHFCERCVDFTCHLLGLKRDDFSTKILHVLEYVDYYEKGFCKNR